MVVDHDDYVPTEEEKRHMVKIESRPSYTEWLAKTTAEAKKKFGL